MSVEDQQQIHDLVNQVAEANRTLDKAKEVLENCYKYFNFKSQMNAAQHLAGRTIASPIESNIDSVLSGIAIYEKVYKQ